MIFEFSQITMQETIVLPKINTRLEGTHDWPRKRFHKSFLFLTHRYLFEGKNKKEPALNASLACLKEGSKLTWKLFDRQ